MLGGGLPALAQPDPSGIDFVTIGAPGNPAYQSTGQALENGRGSVAYEFRIGRYEVTSGQWSQFFAAALNRPDPVPWVERPTVWGGGGSGAMLPTGGVTWRTCAIYCNWQHNNRSLDRAAFMSGAYDVSTFGYDANGDFTDQGAHTPGARFWVRTMDEWLKAAHYDPNKANPDGSRGGWWAYNNGSDLRPVYGPPPSMGGTGQANAGFTLQGDAQFGIPLGAYTDVASPWGLIDVAGGTRELTESIVPNNRRQYRIVRGSAWATPIGEADRLNGGWGGVFPDTLDFAYGFRIAAAVPPPPGVLAFAVGLSWCIRRRARMSNALRSPDRPGDLAGMRRRRDVRRRGARTPAAPSDAGSVPGVQRRSQPPDGNRQRVFDLGLPEHLEGARSRAPAGCVSPFSIATTTPTSTRTTPPRSSAPSAAAARVPLTAPHPAPRSGTPRCAPRSSPARSPPREAARARRRCPTTAG